MHVRIEIVSYIPDDEKHLIISAFKEKFKEDKDAHLKLNIKDSPRIGSAKAFIIGCARNDIPISDFIAKIDRKEKIDEEYERYIKCISNQQMVNESIYKGIALKDRGIILSEHPLGQSDITKQTSEIEEPTKTSFTTFENLLQKEDIGLEKKEQVLKAIFEGRFEGVNRGCKKKSCNFVLHYKGGGERDSLGLNIPNYVEREEFSLDDLKNWMAFSKNKVKLFDYDIFDVVNFVNSFSAFQEETEIVVKNLHGDLHPKNVYITKLFDPRLIDFRWSHRGHALKDYVLMESSLFLFSLPHLKTPIEKMLTAITIAVDQFIEPKDDSLPNALSSALRLIALIRKEAAKFCIWNSKEAEYYCSLFLVILGLIQIKGANTLAGLYWCLKLAKRIEEIYRNDKNAFKPCGRVSFLKEGMTDDKREENTIERDAGKQKEEIYAMMLSNEYPEGVSLNREEVGNLIENRSDYDIFIIDDGEYNRDDVGAVWFRGEPASLQAIRVDDSYNMEAYDQKKKKCLRSALSYRILVYTLKEACMPGEIYHFVEHCWGQKNIALSIKHDMEKLSKGEISSVDFNDLTNTYRSGIGKVSKYLQERLRTELRSQHKRKYKLSSIPKYCLLYIYENLKKKAQFIF